MGRPDQERAAVRKLREELGLSREKFSALMRERGFEFSGVTIEAYEKEVPAPALEAFAQLALEKNLRGIAEELTRSGIGTPPLSGSTRNPLPADTLFALKSLTELARELADGASELADKLGHLVVSGSIDFTNRTSSAVRRERKALGARVKGGKGNPGRGEEKAG